MQSAVYPKNILMVGPTGCGKSELVRTLSNLSNSPFIKVEATQYTEIGYHGKDVEQIITELTARTFKKLTKDSPQLSQSMVEELDTFMNLVLLDAMVGQNFKDDGLRRDKLDNLIKGLYDDLYINIDIPTLTEDSKYPSIEEYLGSLPQVVTKSTTAKLPKSMTVAGERFTGKVSDARSILQAVFVHHLADKIDTKKKCISDIENEGIIFIDEIDKIVMSNERVTTGRNPSSDGVQRDLLPLIEGTTISTKYGDVNTTNILFICAGAFSSVKPSDMTPELLGRLPNRIGLTALTRHDFKKILTSVENNLIDQYVKLMATEGITLTFTEGAIDLICKRSLV